METHEWLWVYELIVIGYSKQKLFKKHNWFDNTSWTMIEILHDIIIAITTKVHQLSAFRCLVMKSLVSILELNIKTHALCDPRSNVCPHFVNPSKSGQRFKCN